MKMTNAPTAVLLVGMLLGSSFLATENVRAWTAEVSAGPTSVTEGDVVEISITVKNTGSDSMKVTWVGIHFDWQSEDQEYGCSDVPQILASGATYTFKISGVPIPEGITTHTYHPSTIRIRAADLGLIAEGGGFNQRASISSLSWLKLLRPRPPHLHQTGAPLTVILLTTTVPGFPLFLQSEPLA